MGWCVKVNCWVRRSLILCNWIWKQIVSQDFLLVDMLTKETDSDTAYHVTPPHDGPEDAQQSNRLRHGCTSMLLIATQWVIYRKGWGCCWVSLSLSFLNSNSDDEFIRILWSGRYPPEVFTRKLLRTAIFNLWLCSALCQSKYVISQYLFFFSFLFIFIFIIHFYFYFF